MKTIFSKAYATRHSNFAPALAAALPGLGSLIPEGACFGDAACQKNRTEQNQIAALNAAAQLEAAKAANLNAASSSEQNKVLLYVGIGFGVVILILGALFITKKQS